MRLIDANAALEQVCVNCCCDFEECKRIGFCADYMNIERLPTVDAVEVVHGRWEVANDGTHFCSNCGCDAPYTWDDIDRNFINSADDVPNRQSNYCPNCGAQMDGGNEDG